MLCAYLFQCMHVLVRDHGISGALAMYIVHSCNKSSFLVEIHDGIYSALLYLDGLLCDFGISSALAVDIPHSPTKIIDYEYHRSIVRQ